MSMIFIANATTKRLVIAHRTGLNASGAAEIEIPAGRVVSLNHSLDFMRQIAPYIKPWSGSGVGYSIDTPITL